MQGLTNTENSQIPKDAFYINLDHLLNKRVSIRESALSFNIRAFTENRQNYEFMKNNFITLLYGCLDSIKKGSANEISLAAHTIGLMAVTVGHHRAREIYVESLPVLSAALKSASVSSQILECLVLVTFFGAENCEDTESTMQLIWKLIHKKSASTAVASKHSSPILVTAISAWTFLLASMDGWKLSYKHWQGATCYFSALLIEEEDEAVGLAAVEALALILEIGFFEKFSSHCSSMKSDEIMEKLKKFILKFRAQYHESEDSSKEVDFICDVLKLFEDDHYNQASMNIGGHMLTLSTYSQLIQLNFLKQFLGRGFEKHMLENEFLQSVFDFTPEKHFHHEKIWEEATVMYFIPEARTKKSRRRLFLSPNSAYNKAKTQLLNKNRMLTKRGSIGHGDE